MTEQSPDTTSDNPAPDDRRTDIERAVEDDPDFGRDAAQGARPGPTPLEPTGVPDGNSGTGGVTKNQDDTAQ